jgi:hypothetical protein
VCSPGVSKYLRGRIRKDLATMERCQPALHLIRARKFDVGGEHRQ